MTDVGEVAELLIPPGLAPEKVRPLNGGKEIELGGETMGTGWKLAAVVPPGLDEREIGSALDGAFAQIIAQMSQWDPRSELSRFNRAEPSTRFSLSPQFAYVLDCAVQVARASDGLFDPAIGGASELWGFGAGNEPAELPSREAAAQALTRSWRDLVLEDGGKTVVQPGGLLLDLSGIAKGFAVDFGMNALEALGIHHAMLEIGGELRGAGVRLDGMPWWVDLEIPPGSDAPHARIGLTGWAVATSGNYRRRRKVAGRSWSHSIDPATGMPLVDEVLAVSVLHRGCMQADALATAIIVMGAEKGMHFAGAHGIPARIVMRGETQTSAAWREWLN